MGLKIAEIPRLSIEEGMYAVREDVEIAKGVTESRPVPFKDVLEKLAAEKGDDTAKYDGHWDVDPVTGQPIVLSAYQRQLLAYGLGKDEPISKFWASANSLALFPQWTSDQLMAGRINASFLDRLVSARTVLNTGTSAKVAHIENTLGAGSTSAPSTTKLAPGVAPPVVNINTQDHTVNLSQFGLTIEVDDVTIQDQSLDVLSVMLQRIGSQLGLDETMEALKVIIAGDGNSNSVTTYTLGATVATLTYNHLVDSWAQFPQAYTPKVMFADIAVVAQILKIAQFQDPEVGFSFQRTGQMVTPLGMELVRFDTGSSGTSYLDDHIVMVDPTISLEHFVRGGTNIEYDRIVRKGLNGATLKIWEAFGKMDVNAHILVNIVT